jgi:uncharacterized protein
LATFLIYTKKSNNLDEDGDVLVYDNMKSSLTYFATGDSVVEVEPKEYESATQVSFENPGKKTTPRVLKIQLGLSCNYACEYCNQRFVPHADAGTPGQVEEFVSGMDHWVKEPPERIEFWGGEPLVYIKTLMPLAEALRVKYPDTQFSIITNGSLLNVEINEWLDRMGFAVGISHDGPGQATRGPDPLQDPMAAEGIRDLFVRLYPKGRVGFNTMMHKGNPSRAAVAKFFEKLLGTDKFDVGEGAMVDAYDEGGVASSLKEADLVSYSKLAFKEIRSGEAKNFQFIRQKMIGFMDSIKNAAPANSIGQKCSMDKQDQLSVDMQGNILTCQNVSAVSVTPSGVSHKIGHTSDLAGAELRSATHWSHREDCKSCAVLHICRGACMFLSGPLWVQTCNSAYADAVPILAASIEAMTGLIPYRIEGSNRADRESIWEYAPPKKVIPIVAV